MARLLAAAVLLALVVVGPPLLPKVANAPRAHPGEFAEAVGRLCPVRSPEPVSPGRLGGAVPLIPAPERAWTCRYDLPGWRRIGSPRPVPGSRVHALGAALRGLAPVTGQRDCPSDLGPRWMVVLDHDGDLTGVLVEGYGCRDVHLVAEPHRAGSPTGGLLTGGVAILDVLGLDH